MSALSIWLYCRLLVLDVPDSTRLRPRRDEAGQASAEYALVLLGAAAVALLLVAWATRTNRVGRLLDTVFDQLLSKVR